MSDNEDDLDETQNDEERRLKKLQNIYADMSGDESVVVCLET